MTFISVNCWDIPSNLIESELHSVRDCSKDDIPTEETLKKLGLDECLGKF